MSYASFVLIHQITFAAASSNHIRVPSSLLTLKHSAMSGDTEYYEFKPVCVCAPGIDRTGASWCFSSSQGMGKTVVPAEEVEVNVEDL